MKLATAAGSAASPAVAGTIKRSLCAGRSRLTTHNKQTTRSCNILARWHGAWGHNNKGAATTMMQHWQWQGQGQSGGNNKNKLLVAHKTVEVKSRFSCLFYFFSPLSSSLFLSISLSLIALLSTNFFGFFLFPFDDDAALLIVAGNYFFSVNCCDCSVKMGKGERKGRGRGGYLVASPAVKSVSSCVILLLHALDTTERSRQIVRT